MPSSANQHELSVNLNVCLMYLILYICMCPIEIPFRHGIRCIAAAAAAGASANIIMQSKKNNQPFRYQSLRACH